MFFKLFRLPIVAALAVSFAALVQAGPSEARNWLRALERHDEAADANRFVPKGGNPQWDFDLRTMLNDMEWRARTASMLRNLPKPGDDRDATPSSQLADGEQPRRLQFRF